MVSVQKSLQMCREGLPNIRTDLSVGWRNIRDKGGNLRPLTRFACWRDSSGTSGVERAKEPTAAYYRAVAEEITQVASKARFPQTRIELLELAERFRRMAIYVEHRYPSRSAQTEL